MRPFLLSHILMHVLMVPFEPAAELKATFQLPIIGVKKNPQSPMVRTVLCLSRLLLRLL